MQNDKTTLKDLSIFGTDGSRDVFSLIDRTVTQEGRGALHYYILHPPDSFEALRDTQETVKFWAENKGEWPTRVSNGTLVMLQKFFESADADVAPPSGISLMVGAFFQKMLNRNQYFFIQFSLSHLADFFKDCIQLTTLLDGEQKIPGLLKRQLEEIKDELKHRLVSEVTAITKETSYATLIKVSFSVRREMKNLVYRLMQYYAQVDAWQAMGTATLENNWTFPELLPGRPVTFDARGLYHPLLETPLPYDITFRDQHNFLLLTGANMSGKTTFMRALGVSALLAHIGMGVPARALRISFLHGIITNMYVEDNILKGESYFFAEVQRMKHTAQKLLQPEPQMVLMDELFKGTNVHDAYECTRAVVDGLLHHNHHLMILSTHLYEVAQHFSHTAGILFSYFVTDMAADGSYQFTYRLASGISNDRIGYRILQKEGVIKLLSGQ